MILLNTGTKIMMFPTPRPLAVSSSCFASLVFFILTTHVFGQSSSSTSTSDSYSEEDSQSTSTSTVSTQGGNFPNNVASNPNQWCGKARGSSSNAPNTEGQFFAPPVLSEPLLSLKCAPKLKPYIQADDSSIGSIIVDAVLTFYEMEGAVAVPQNVEQLQIVIINTNTSRAITSGIVGINTIGNDLQFPLKELGQPSLQSYDIICQAYANDEWLAESSIPVDYLPMYQNSGAGNIVRISSESGTLMVTSQQGVLETIIPFGFVVDFRSNLQLSRIGQFVEYLQNLQVNTVQLIFSSQDYKNLTQLNLVLRTMSQAGIWVIYDVRNFYRDNALVKAHLETAKEYPNVLLYHTAMEPDGNQCSMDGLLLASQVIRQEDPYHPLATTLNCEDYYFSNYTDSTDIVVTNPYVIGVEPESRSSNFPSVTPQPTMYCNSTYGSCRCDNCKGTFLDLVHRLRLFRERRHILGKDRTMLFWGVPRSRGATDGSNRAPSGEQFLLTCTIYIIEGAVGLMTWNEKMDLSSDLAQGVQTFGSVLPTIANYLEKPQAFLPLPKTKPYPTDTFIANMWINRDTQKMLLLVANLASKAVSWKIDPPNCTMSSNSLPQTSYLYVSKGAQQAQAIYEGEKLKLKGQLNGYGFGAWIIACGLQDKKAKR